MTPQWTDRSATALVLLATGLTGMLFTPVFGAGALALPIAMVLVVCFAVAELTMQVRSLTPWRPVLALLLGLLALGILEFGLGTQLFGGLLDGLTQSWQLTLQSTWPARPDPELLLFVPLAVLLASVLGMELLRRPAVALVPGLLVAGLSQAYVALSGAVATAVGLAFVVVAGALLMLTRRHGSRPVLLIPTAVLAVAVSVGITAFDQGTQPPFAVQHEAAPVPLRIDDPLDQIADRLSHPATPVFSYYGAAPSEAWRMAVLDDFDGVTWRSEPGYRRLGASLGEIGHHTRITVPASTDGPWLPSQAEPAAVNGVAPLVDPDTGVLLLPGRSGSVSYDLGWRDPPLPAGSLLDAAIDPAAVTGGLGQIPPGVAELARTATGGVRPTFRAALQLERYLGDNYRLAAGPVLPTGSGWAQLRTFLFGTKAGTSEQFAAAYVALARITGIPARIAVGFRAPAGGSGTVTVHNGDVLAWPEVAVAGVGWVPLDPTGTAASGTGQAAGKLAQVTAQARKDLPPPPQLHDPDVPKDDGATDDDGSSGSWLSIPPWWLPAGLALLLVLLAAAIPTLRTIRTARRHRRTGADGVVAAWQEARDLLRARGMVVPPGATVRDLTGLLPSTVDESVAEGLEWLARQVDLALWSPADPDESTVSQAWTAVRAIRKGLSDAPLRARLRAAFDVRSLLPGRAPGARVGL